MIRLPGNLLWVDETDSTNRLLTSYCDGRHDDVAELTCIAADFQTAGKGQRGNRWEAAYGKNLLFSIVLYPGFLEARRQFILSQLVALAVKEELEQWASPVSIKWPNDIYVGHRKICGILIEHDLDGACLRRTIAGVGININQQAFAGDAPNPVSLRQLTGREHDRRRLLLDIVSRLRSGYAPLRADSSGHYAAGVAGRYAGSLYRREGFHPYADAAGPFMGRLLRVEPDGRYVLEDMQGRERPYRFKEVAFLDGSPPLAVSPLSSP